ncbi:MAG: divalent-cation tolerance protein CutA [Rudaea sp.]
MSAILVLCTCPDSACAERIAAALVEERLVACVNRISGIESTYRWQGKVCHDSEQLLLIKTTRQRFDALRDRIVALHPNQVPEVVAVDIMLGLERYLDWIKRETEA